MPYLSATKLEERVREAGLQSLSDLLHKIVIGDTTWAGPSEIVVLPEGREQIRNLIYGLLHHVGLKEHFQVTAPQPDKLIVDKKKGKKYIARVTNVYAGQTETTAAEELDLSSLFSEPAEYEKETEEGQ